VLDNRSRRRKGEQRERSDHETTLEPFCRILLAVLAQGIPAPSADDLIGSGLTMYMQMGGNPGDGAPWRVRPARRRPPSPSASSSRSSFRMGARDMINQFKEAVAAKPTCIEIMGHPGGAAFHDLVKAARTRASS
jgi:hypothetical protein